MSSPVAALADALDRRLGRRADPPSVWPTDFGALLSHAAIVAFLVLTVTGVALALAYRPSVDEVVYLGSSELYHGQNLPHAFASVAYISEDLPGGLLLRRLHVAAAHLFVLSLAAHLIRTLLLGSFRRPRLLTHLTGIGLLLAALAFNFTGELLPFGLVAGSSLRIAEAVLYSLPFMGEQLGMLVLGGELPSQRFLTLAWAAHVLLLPVAFVALLGWHLLLVHRRGPALEARSDVDVETTAIGRPLWPDAVARFTLLTAGLTAVLLLSAALVPWADAELEGPFLTAEATNSVHPAWPLFFLTGGLRVLPAIDVVVLGVRISNVLVAGVIVPTVLIVAVTVYPCVERLVLRDTGEHHRLDHPLDVPFRAVTVTVMTALTLVFTFGAGVDVLSFWLGVPVEAVVRTFQVLVVALPGLAGALVYVASVRHLRVRGRAGGGPARADAEVAG